MVDAPLDSATERALHKTIAAVRQDYADLAFNTAIARLMEYNNVLTRLDAVPRSAIEPMLLMVGPVAPHIAEELWARLGHDESLAFEPFPAADEALVVDETVTCVVQIGGKVRGKLQVPADIDEAAALELALADPAVTKWIADNRVVKVISRLPRMLSLVVG